MTKLQALAAQRKRKAEEAKKSKDTGTRPVSGDPAGEDVRELRNKAAKLSIDSPIHSPPKETDTAMAEAFETGPLLETDVKADQQSSEKWKPVEPLLIKDVGREDTVRIEEPAMIAAPSAFAKTLFGSRKTSQHFEAPYDSNHTLLAVPSLSRAPSSAFDAFLEPSPDDVVLDAQAKGWRRSHA